MQSKFDQVTGEIVALHDFISAWFRGDEPGDRKTYEAGFSGRLVSNFINIQPSGKILSKSDLADPIFNGHGSNPDFRIEIKDVEIRYSSQDAALILATYVEVQHGAINSKPSTNARRSTVLFACNPPGNSMKWVHVHETAVPMDQRS